jgi:hypothetical protein
MLLEVGFCTESLLQQRDSAHGVIAWFQTKGLPSPCSGKVTERSEREVIASIRDLVSTAQRVPGTRKEAWKRRSQL